MSCHFKHIYSTEFYKIKHFNLYKIQKWRITFKGKIYILSREKNGGEGKKLKQGVLQDCTKNREISTKYISYREVFIKRGCVLTKEKRGRKWSDIGGHEEGKGVS